MKCTRFVKKNKNNTIVFLSILYDSLENSETEFDRSLGQGKAIKHKIQPNGI